MLCSNRNPSFKNHHLRSVKYTATFTQKLAVIMADENNNNGDGVLISKPIGHHNQLYVKVLFVRRLLANQLTVWRDDIAPFLRTYCSDSTVIVVLLDLLDRFNFLSFILILPAGGYLDPTPPHINVQIFLICAVYWFLFHMMRFGVRNIIPILFDALKTMLTCLLYIKCCVLGCLLEIRALVIVLLF